MQNESRLLSNQLNSVIEKKKRNEKRKSIQKSEKNVPQSQQFQVPIICRIFIMWSVNDSAYLD
jgi:hypothetical protein